LHVPFRETAKHGHDAIRFEQQQQQQQQHDNGSLCRLRALTEGRLGVVVVCIIIALFLERPCQAQVGSLLVWPSIGMVTGATVTLVAKATHDNVVIVVAVRNKQQQQRL
jgi:nicotinamide riboside transporter PnuC